MSKILIMNMGTEQMSGTTLNRRQHVLSASGACRNTWLARAGDIVVSPLPMQPEFLAYVGRTLGFDPASVSVVSPADHADRGALTDRRLLSPAIVEELQRRLTGSRLWTLDACYQSDGVAELGQLLGCEGSVGQRFAAQRGCDLLNRKSHFRQFAAGAQLPVADGSIADSPSSLALALQQHLPRTGTAIVKQDNGAAGTGNIAITRAEARPLPGCRETLRAAGDLESLANRLWEDLTDRWNQSLVVESYHAAARIFYLEYLIREDAGAVFLNSGTVRLRPSSDPDAKDLHWIGLELPAELPEAFLSQALTHSLRLVALAAQIGYRGPLNIDAIVTDGGELLFNEVNARWGGGSNLHAIGERLLGEGFANTHVLSSLREVKSPPLHDVLRRLRERGLDFDPAAKRGVLVLAYDGLETNTMEYLLIETSRARVRELETLLLRALSRLD